MDKTLFYDREDDKASYGPTFNTRYDKYWWTFPGANNPLAPDTQSDPMAALRQGDGTIPKYFTLGKISQTLMTQAKRKRNLISVLGADWTVDGNEALTGDAGATYEGVTFTEEYAFMRDLKCNGEGDRLSLRRSWRRQLSELVNKISGKTWKISPDNDRWYYRTGRVEVTDPSQTGGEIAITADCAPWKYEKYSTLDEWVWDDLDFEYGVIRERGEYVFNLAKNESNTVSVIPLEKAEPVWIWKMTDDEVVLEWGASKTQTLPSETGSGGTWYKTECIPTPEAYQLTITNNSNNVQQIMVYYRGAMR